MTEAKNSELPQQVTQEKTSKTKLILAMVLAVAIGAVGYLWWRGKYFEETDNAYVEGYISAIAPRVDGVVKSILFTDNQSVKSGDILLEIDPADYSVRVDEIKAQILELDANLVKLNADLTQAEAKVRGLVATSARRSAELKRYKQDAERQLALRNKDIKAVTGTELDAALAAKDSAQADYAAQQEEIRSAQAAVEAVRASKGMILARKDVAMARLREAELQLSYTVVRAPVDGRIGNKSVEIGNHVSKGQRLVAIIKDEVWIVANFKETQLKGLRVGQHVSIKIDTFPKNKIMGTIDSFAPASGAKFALLPPENATGNFTKIVQRIPVKINFDADTQKNLMDRIVPGMSATIEVDLRETKTE